MDAKLPTAPAAPAPAPAALKQAQLPSEKKGTGIYMAVEDWEFRLPGNKVTHKLLKGHQIKASKNTAAMLKAAAKDGKVREV